MASGKTIQIKGETYEIFEGMGGDRIITLADGRKVDLFQGPSQAITDGDRGIPCKLVRTQEDPTTWQVYRLDQDDRRKATLVGEMPVTATGWPRKELARACQMFGLR